MFKGYSKIMISLILGLICVGCSTSVCFNRKDAKGKDLSENDKCSANHPPILYPGSKFIYQDIGSSDGRVSRVTMEVKDRKPFEHKQAYWIDVTENEMNYFSIYAMDLNWIGMFGEGKKLESAEPCLQILRWPL